MIDYLKFIFYFSIIPVTFTYVILLKYLEYFLIIYLIGDSLCWGFPYLLYVANCFWWGTIFYKRNEIELFIRKIWRR